MSKYTNHEILTKLIEDTDWYHINSNGELVLGATSDTALYKASDILTIIRDVSTTDVEPMRHAYWDWQCDGTHFCSECGTDALYTDEGREFCSLWCPHCGAYMTHQEDQI